MYFGYDENYSSGVEVLSVVPKDQLQGLDGQGSVISPDLSQMAFAPLPCWTSRSNLVILLQKSEVCLDSGERRSLE
jgi:hypothetical protein